MTERKRHHVSEYLHDCRALSIQAIYLHIYIYIVLTQVVFYACENWILVIKSKLGAIAVEVKGRH